MGVQPGHSITPVTPVTHGSPLPQELYLTRFDYSCKLKAVIKDYDRKQRS